MKTPQAKNVIDAMMTDFHTKMLNSKGINKGINRNRVEALKLAVDKIDKSDRMILNLVKLAFDKKSQIIGMYGEIAAFTKELPKMEELLFNLSQQATTNGIGRLKDLAGDTVAHIAVILFPGVTVNDKFEDHGIL